MVSRSTDREAQHTDRTSSTCHPRRDRAHFTSYIGGKRPLASIALLAIALLVAPVAATLPVDTASTWVQTDKLTAELPPELDTASDLVNRPWVSVGQDDWFGQSIALSGELLAVGAPRADNWPTDEPGEVFLYEQGDVGWVQVARLSAGVGDDNFGWSVAIDGTTLVVGAPHWREAPASTYVYEETGDGWTLVDTLTVSGATCFGASVAVDGDRFVVGAPCEDHVDAVIYERGPAGWTEAARILEASAGWHSGHAVDLSDDRLVVGGVLGPAYVYELAGAAWQASDVLETQRSRSVAIGGDRIAVGDRLSDEVRIFEEADGAWAQVAGLEPPLDAVRDRAGFGQALAFAAEGEILVVGAYTDDPSPVGSPELPDSPTVPVINIGPGDRGRQTGAVHVYERGPAGWDHVDKVAASDARSERNRGDRFGSSVAVSAEGDVLFGGAPGDACCDDPLNAGFITKSSPLLDSPCGFSTFTCFYKGEEPDAVYAFTIAGKALPGGLS